MNLFLIWQSLLFVQETLCKNMNKRWGTKVLFFSNVLCSFYRNNLIKMVLIISCSQGNKQYQNKNSKIATFLSTAFISSIRLVNTFYMATSLSLSWTYFILNLSCTFVQTNWRMLNLWMNSNCEQWYDWLNRLGSH